MSAILLPQCVTVSSELECTDFVNLLTIFGKNIDSNKDDEDNITSTATENSATVLHVSEEKGSFNVPS